jgi:hypothetical protein
MRYELHFAPAGPVVPDRAAFERHFAGRDHYTVGKGVARYENDDTDVSFTFEFLTEPPARSGDVPAWARLSIDVVRPSFFAEESLPELEAFAARFGGGIRYPDGVTSGVYNRAIFLRTWEEMNRLACGPYPADAPPDKQPFTLPRARLLPIWQWNYRRAQLQAQGGDSLFVPRIWLVRLGQGVGTAVVWPDAMAVRTPQVDLVIFSREILAPRTRTRPRPDVAVAPWAVIAGSITGQAFFDNQIANWRITDERVLNGLARTVASLRGTTEMPDVVSAETVLDRECFA